MVIEPAKISGHISTSGDPQSTDPAPARVVRETLTRSLGVCLCIKMLFSFAKVSRKICVPVRKFSGFGQARITLLRDPAVGDRLVDFRRMRTLAKLRRSGRCERAFAGLAFSRHRIKGIQVEPVGWRCLAHTADRVALPPDMNDRPSNNR